MQSIQRLQGLSHLLERNDPIVKFPKHRIDLLDQVFTTVTNLFNKRYQSFGVLGANAFTGPNRTFNGASPVNEQFVTPGATRSIWIGLRYAWQ